MLDKYMCDVMNSDAFLLHLKLYDLMLIPTRHILYMNLPSCFTSSSSLSSNAIPLDWLWLWEPYLEKDDDDEDDGLV